MFQPDSLLVPSQVKSNPRGCEQNTGYIKHRSPPVRRHTDNGSKTPGDAGTHSRKTQELTDSSTHRGTDTPTARSPCEAGQRTAADSEPQKSEETRPLLNRQSIGRVQVPVLYCTVSTRCHRRAGVSFRTRTKGYEFIQRHRVFRVVAGVSHCHLSIGVVSRKKKKNRGGPSNYRVRLRHRLPCADNHFRPSAPQCRG